jgi:hypothetical protein
LFEVGRMQAPVGHENVVLPKRIRADRRIAGPVLVGEVEAVQEEIALGVFEILELAAEVLAGVTADVGLVVLALLAIARRAGGTDDRAIEDNEAAFADDDFAGDVLFERRHQLGWASGSTHRAGRGPCPV